MNTLSKICAILMLAGGTSLMAADTAPASNDANVTPGGRGGKGGPRMHERGDRGPRGGHGRFSMLVCPNCHHRLIVLAPHGGKGGPGGREGGRRGPGPGRRGGAPAQKPQTNTQEK